MFFMSIGVGLDRVGVDQRRFGGENGQKWPKMAKNDKKMLKLASKPPLVASNPVQTDSNDFRNNMGPLPHHLDLNPTLLHRNLGLQQVLCQKMGKKEALLGAPQNFFCTENPY